MCSSHRLSFSCCRVTDDFSLIWKKVLGCCVGTRSFVLVVAVSKSQHLECTEKREEILSAFSRQGFQPSESFVSSWWDIIFILWIWKVQQSLLRLLALCRAAVLTALSPNFFRQLQLLDKCGCLIFSLKLFSIAHSDYSVILESM